MAGRLTTLSTWKPGDAGSIRNGRAGGPGRTTTTEIGWSAPADGAVRLERPNRSPSATNWIAVAAATTVRTSLIVGGASKRQLRRSESTAAKLRLGSGLGCHSLITRLIGHVSGDGASPLTRGNGSGSVWRVAQRLQRLEVFLAASAHATGVIGDVAGMRPRQDFRRDSGCAH